MAQHAEVPSGPMRAMRPMLGGMLTECSPFGEEGPHGRSAEVHGMRPCQRNCPAGAISVDAGVGCASAIA